MTRNQRVRIGGWGALVAALAAPVLIAVVLGGSGPIAARAAMPSVLWIETARLTGLLVAVIGVDPLLDSLDPRLARLARFAGIVGALLGLGAVLSIVASAPMDPLLLSVPAQVALAAWFAFGGIAFSRHEGGRHTLGLSGQFGAASLLFAAGGALLPSDPLSADSISPAEYATVLAVFSLVYLVRLWRFATFGRLPASGLI